MAAVADLAQARSSAHRALPPAEDPGAVSLLLFYAYREPAWTDAEHRKALAEVLAIGARHSITGRGRCAPEGLNCTLTGRGGDVRQFCAALRNWDGDLFGPADFKVTDGLEESQRFKALTIRKTEELVGYGLANDRAPQLATNSARHLEADAYHKALETPGAVVIDVRNQYETEIGRIVPPPGGAELLDPKIRNSHEFPRWLNLPETKKKLAGRSVLMYCTGGIRCERASALLHDMNAAPTCESREDCANKAAAAALLDSADPPKEILMVRGGIERYLRTFPEGGYWRGANYLFDKRFEQRPEKQADRRPLGSCAACLAPCDEYRGKFACSAKDCRVPVVVCAACRDPVFADAAKRPALAAKLRCRLCRENHAGARATPLPDCVLKGGADDVARRAAAKRQRDDRATAKAARPPARFVFVGNLPFTAERSEVLDALSLDRATPLTWLLDRTTRLFYGSAVITCADVAAASKVVDAAGRRPRRVRGRKLRVNFGGAGGDGCDGPRPPCARPRPLLFSTHRRPRGRSFGPGLSRPGNDRTARRAGVKYSPSVVLPRMKTSAAHDRTCPAAPAADRPPRRGPRARAPQASPSSRRRRPSARRRGTPREAHNGVVVTVGRGVGCCYFGRGFARSRTTMAAARADAKVPRKDDVVQ